MIAQSAVVWGVVAVVGAAVGSFLNVVILRTKQERAWWSGRSACPHCGTTLAWYELVPVLSFVALGGQCRHCHTALTKQYFLVEVLTAVAFVLIYWVYGLSALTVVGWACVSAMVVLAVYDARWALLPDSFSIVFGVLAIGVSWLAHRSWIDILIGGAAGAAFFTLQYLASKKQWVGSGDILLGADLGLLLGWRMLGLSLFMAYMVGAMVAAGLILARRAKGTSSMPFGPYLLGGGMAAWLWGERIVNWYFSHAIFK